MPDPSERQRTVLRAPRAEFDLSAWGLGACGWLAYQWSWPALASVLAVPEVSQVPPWLGLRYAFFGRLFGWMQLPFTDTLQRLVGVQGGLVGRDGDKQVPYVLELEGWKIAVVAVWLLVLWSIVAGAISRVYAVRIARDESVGAADGVAFSLSNLKAFLMAPLFVATVAGLFVGLAALAGAAAAVPMAGPFLEIVLHPLALIAALVAVVVATGGVFGLPLMQAAVATERNGALDAASRTFSYCFTRPVAYVASLVIVSTVAAVIAAFGFAFLFLAFRALTFGAGWNENAQAAMGAGAGLALAGDGSGVLGWPRVTKGEGIELVWVYVSWAVTTLGVIAVSGYVLSYFVGGMTDTYFLLRREVDGIDESEVYTEGEEASLGEPLPGEPREPPATT
jgi:hypothetical protein